MAGRAERPPIFKRLRTGLEEGARFARGEQDLRTASAPPRPPQIGPGDVAALRRRLGMTPGDFAGLLNVSPRAVRDWERGTRSPSQAALRLIQVLGTRPELVFEIIGIAVVGGAARPIAPGPGARQESGRPRAGRPRRAR